MCAKRIIKLACAFAADQSIRCPQDETLNRCLVKLRSMKVLIRLCDVQTDLNHRWAHMFGCIFSTNIVSGVVLIRCKEQSFRMK